MSRADKRIHRERIVGTAKDGGVRIFAFANTRPGYQVVFSPEQPIVILKTKKAAGGVEQHPCAQWEPFSDIVFQKRPNTTHAVYLADITALSTRAGMEQEELVNGAAVGGTMRQLGNAIARLNTHNATLVAAGVSAHTALKYMLLGEKTLGHRDRLIERLVLVCPSSLEELVRLTDAAARALAVPSPNSTRDPSYPKPSVTVLLKGNKDAAAAYEQWLSSCASLIADFTIELDLTPNLFAAVARHAMRADAQVEEGAVDTNSRYEHPRVYRIDFVLSKATKNVEQLPVLSPLDTAGVDSEPDEEGEDEEEDESLSDTEEAAHEHHSHGDGEGHGGHHHHSHDHDGGCGCCPDDADACNGDEEEGDEDLGSRMYVGGITCLQQWKEPVRIMLEGRIVDLTTGLVGTTEGCVVVEGLAELVAADEPLTKLVEEKQKKKKGSVCVALATRLLRDEHGRTSLKALEVRVMTKREEKQSMTAGASLAEIPLAYNASAIAHSYGAVLLRGRKCALVRDVEGHGDRQELFLPHQPLVDSMESGSDCAIRALCEACEVSSDNFYCPSFLPPVVYYTQEKDDEGAPMTRCVTLYIALAVSPPPRGPASDAREDHLDPTEPYDWVSFDRALTLLSTAADRAALQEVVLALKKATAAGLYKTFPGCGFFGDKVQGGAGAATNALPVSLAGTVELVVILCPGCRTLPDALTDAVCATFSVPGVHTYDAESSTTTLTEVVEAAATSGLPTVAVFLNQVDVDVDDFCEEQLLELLEHRGLKSRFVSALTPSLCDELSDLSGGIEKRAALVDALLAAARVSDTLSLTVAPPFPAVVAKRPVEAEQVMWALLRCCVAANDELTVLRGLQRSGGQRITADEIAVKVGATSSSPTPSQQKQQQQLQHLRFALSELTVPVAPAALEYLTRPGSLSAFTVTGESFLLTLSGVAWVAMRQETQALLSSDLANACLLVDGGESWKSLSGEDAVQRTVLQFDILCASDAAAEKVRATAAEMLRQLAWNPTRDGSDVGSLKDPLPLWDV